MEESSLERAHADLKLLLAAYPDEVNVSLTDNGDHHHSTASFPLSCQFQLEPGAFVQLQFQEGYPNKTGVTIASYRSKPQDKARIEAVASAVRRASQACLDDELEGGLACASAALEAWNNHHQLVVDLEQESSIQSTITLEPTKTFHWTSGTPITDRKSTFQAHACRVECEADIQPALEQLLDSSNRIQSAYHNMFAWRLTEKVGSKAILKHDNDDDGEDAAGSRLAQLLEMRKDDGVLVVVSRWYGGILLGPARFRHITNCARELLVECQDEWAREDVAVGSKVS